MVPKETCPDCGRQLINTLEGLCPYCLVAMGQRLVYEGDFTDTTAPAEERIGRYRLVEKLGEGGCGVVYRAEQEKPVRRQVALKIIKLGLDSRQWVARFEAERQALALMDHPNIAKVLDAGTTERGRPFFVMELLRGDPITAYCDARALSVAERLQIYLEVCQGIQHAHAKGILHRDIKPSNILITSPDGVPIPKIIDFGIAKALTDLVLTDKTLVTASHQLIGTPAYMSPEQLSGSGLKIDARSDVYNLGVLLYQLLTGNTPFEISELLEAGWEKVRRVLTEEDPPQPSTRLELLDPEEQSTVAQGRGCVLSDLVCQLRGDLDAILMKALQKDREYRYQSAADLAEDIQRFLNHEPVLAKPAGKLYRMHKLVRRNRIVVLATGTVALSLLAALVPASWLLFKQREAIHTASTAEQARTNLLNQASVEEEKARGDVTKSYNAARLARVTSNWFLNLKQGRLEQATSDLRTAVELKPDSDLAFTFAAMLIQTGDLPGYKRQRENILPRFGSTTNSATAAHATEAVLLLPLDTANFEVLTRLADVVTTARPDEPSTASLKGLVEYRRGDSDSAIGWEEKALTRQTIPPETKVVAYAVIAMARYQNKQASEAMAALNQANRIAGENLSKLDLRNVAEQDVLRILAANILLGEARKLLDSKPIGDQNN